MQSLLLQCLRAGCVSVFCISLSSRRQKSAAIGDKGVKREREKV